jgi:excisionase family DNA binding protein
VPLIPRPGCHSWAFFEHTTHNKHAHKQTNKQNTINDALLDNATAAKYLGITTGTLDVWRSTGRYAIPYVKVGRLVKYRQSALDAFLEKNTHGTNDQKITP